MYVGITNSHGTTQNTKLETQNIIFVGSLNGRPTYDLHWKPINYKTWDGILYAHDLDGQWGPISNEFRRDVFGDWNW